MPRFALAVFVAATSGLLPAQNRALELQGGVDGGVSVPFDPAMVPRTGLTVEAWITYDDSTVPFGTQHWPTIARQNLQPRRESWLLRVDAGTVGRRNVKFSVLDSNGQLRDLIWTFSAGELRNWTHLAATYDCQHMRLFKNGNLVATQNMGLREAVQNNGGILRIGDGDRSIPGRETWHGRLDELRIWPVSRTQAEIRTTMNQRLSAMPGKVLTFNFDGDYTDSSRGLVGVPDGHVTFVAGNAGLTQLQPNGSLSFGQPSNTCNRDTVMLLGSLPTVGNAAFAVWAANGPDPGDCPVSALLLATRRAPGTQPPVFGMDFAIDLTSLVTIVLTGPGTRGLGTTRMPLPIPADINVRGALLLNQFVHVDAPCGAQGLSASDGLAFTVL